MKGKDTMKTAVGILAVLMGLCPLLSAAETAKSPAILLQEALYEEQTEGNLDKAIELYGQVLDQAADVERLAARAMYQLGLCHLKKGDETAAAEYFRQVVKKYPTQNSAVRKAQAQLDKIAPQETGVGLYDQATQAVWSTIGSMYGQTCSTAGMKNLYTNSNIHFVNSDFTHWNGGYGFYTNIGEEPVSGRIRLAGTTYPHQKYYDIMGNPLDVEIVSDERPGREKYYNIYLNLPQPLAPGQFYPYAWAIEGSKQLQQMPFSENGKHILTMQNHFGSHAFEVFYLVLPNNLAVDHEEQPTETKTVGDYTIYAWEKEVQPDDNHVVIVHLSKMKDLSPKELADIVEKAVLTISTCAETDPRVKESLESLQGIREDLLVPELTNYLDSESATIRRSAIYILWRGGFSDISAAQSKLMELCSHEETFTRGMAALALGEHKIAAAYDTLADMTLNDKDGYARRCGAYALGLLGDDRALPTLEKALEDPEDMVKQNAQAAITMLTKLNAEQTKTPEPALTQEMYNDIQTDGTILFRNPQWVVNEGTEPITERRFINSDFVQLTKMTDEEGNPVEFTSSHEGNIYRYHVIFDPPIVPGETFSYTSEGTIEGLIKPVANMKDTYRYHMTHSPATGVPTLRIEEYLLPEGAELLSSLSDDMKQSTRDGRILLHVEKIIPAGGNLTTSFKYRLTESKPDPLKAENLIAEGWKLWGQRKLAEAEAKFKEAVRNDPENDGAYQGLGWAQLNQGKKQNAEVSFKKCVKLNPQNSAALNGLGWIEHGKGNLDIAIKWWEKAVKASKGTATASLSGLTQVYMDRQEYAKAAKYYQMWLKAEPNNEDAKAGLEKARRAMK